MSIWVIMVYSGNILAYVAGVMDGDGSFSFIKKVGYKSPLYFPMIQLTNEKEFLIDFFVERFGGRKFVRTKLSKHSKKISYSWKIEKKNQCVPFLEFVNNVLLKNCQVLNLNSTTDYREKIALIEKEEKKQPQQEVKQPQQEGACSPFLKFTNITTPITKRYFISNQKNRTIIEETIKTLTNNQLKPTTKIS